MKNEIDKIQEKNLIGYVATYYIAIQIKKIQFLIFINNFTQLKAHRFLSESRSCQYASTCRDMVE